MALIQQDLLPGTGDHLITFDTETNLEWLSLTRTLNFSISDVKKGAGNYIPTHKFRYATTSELAVLWNHAGITSFGPGQSVSDSRNSEGIKTLIGLMGGATTYPNMTQTRGIVMISDRPGFPEEGQLWFFTNNPGGSYATTNIFPNTGGAPAEDYRSSALASYLVRGPMPPGGDTTPPATPSGLRVLRK